MTDNPDTATGTDDKAATNGESPFSDDGDTRYSISTLVDSTFPWAAAVAEYARDRIKLDKVPADKDKFKNRAYRISAAVAMSLGATPADLATLRAVAEDTAATVAADAASMRLIESWDAEDRFTATDVARKRIAVAEAAKVELPPVTSLAELLAADDDPARMRIDRVLPSGGSKTLCVAAAGMGKTTLNGNLIRSLADGDPFLDVFEVHELAARIVLIDMEMTTAMLRRWLRRQGVANVGAVADVVTLRGRAGLFDLGNDRLRDMWARRLGDLGADFLIFDCLKPVLDVMNLRESNEMGIFLSALDTMRTAAGVTDVLVYHHMGHQHERARGDSSVLGWTDANWKIVVRDDDPTQRRYFATDKVRDAEELVGEGLLHFDPGTGRLIYAGGDRVETRRDAGVETMLTRVREVLAEKLTGDGDDEMTTTDIRAAVGGKRQTVADALALAVSADRNLVTVRQVGMARFYRIRPEAIDPAVTSVPTAAGPPEPPPGPFEADIPRNTL